MLVRNKQMRNKQRGRYDDPFSINSSLSFVSAFDITDQLTALCVILDRYLIRPSLVELLESVLCRFDSASYCGHLSKSLKLLHLLIVQGILDSECEVDLVALDLKTHIITVLNIILCLLLLINKSVYLRLADLLLESSVIVTTGEHEQAHENN